MVQITVSKQCKNGKHSQCPGSNKPLPEGKIICGGWKCSCHCHHQTDESSKTPIKLSEKNKFRMG